MAPQSSPVGSDTNQVETSQDLGSSLPTSVEPLPSSANPPLLEFLSSIASKDVMTDAVFDPERAGSDNSDIETDSDEGQAFREKAILTRKETPVQMVKTRSQTGTEKVDLEGKIVFAHKGKSVPFWFPGKVLKKTTKGYEVEFFSRFGVEICTEKNIMPYDYYFLKKNDNSALFKIPAKYKIDFDEAMIVADEISK